MSVTVMAGEGQWIESLRVGWNNLRVGLESVGGLTLGGVLLLDTYQLSIRLLAHGIPSVRQDGILGAGFPRVYVYELSGIGVENSHGIVGSTFSNQCSS